jgi:hypothetical protein
MTSSGLSPLGVVKHLAWVERGWFGETFGGEPVEGLDQSEDGNSLEFALEPHDTVESVLAFYRAEVSRSRTITKAAPSLDTFGHHSSDAVIRRAEQRVLGHPSPVPRFSSVFRDAVKNPP